MPQDDTPKRPRIPLTAATIAAVIGLAFFVIYTSNRGVEVSIGGTKLRVDAEEQFNEVLKRAVEKSPGALVAAIKELPADLDSTRKVRADLRQMLYNLEGPFAAPDTFAGADERLKLALVELDDCFSAAAVSDVSAAELEDPCQRIRKTARAGVFLASLWRDSIERKSVFRPRDLNATVRIVKGAESDGQIRFYTCSDSDLLGRSVEVKNLENGALLEGVLEWNPTIFPRCNGRAKSVTEMFAGEPVELAITIGDAPRLQNPGDTPSVHPGSFAAEFRVQPRNLHSARTVF